MEDDDFWDDNDGSVEIECPFCEGEGCDACTSELESTTLDDLEDERVIKRTPRGYEYD